MEWFDWLTGTAAGCYTMIVTGLALRLLVGSRRFRRRGAGGLYRFPNYPVALLTLFIEWLLKWGATLAILYALLQLLFLNN